MATKIPIHKIQKISVNKSDEVALIVEKIIDADAKEVVLNIPRFSKLADSLSNFHLIRREAALLRKKVIIESVDDKVIELAGVAGLDSWNPILSRTKRQFSDITSSRQAREESVEDETRKKKLVESVERKPVRGRRKPNVRRMLWIGGALVAVAGLFFIANTVLPRADIKLTTVKTEWAFHDSVYAQKLGVIDPNKQTVPGQVFLEAQVLQKSYPASGKKTTQQKATGQVTIYNAYSSDPQPLVATTRLLTPEGKIFRLAKSIVVPGAKIVEGTIIPSTLAADVIADQVGSDYNVGPVTHFTIPGFKGTPKYQAFYAESKTAMAGGYVGTVSYPSDSDLAKAKADMTSAITVAAKQKIIGEIPVDFTVIEGATNVVVIRQNVITGQSGEGMFIIAAEAKASVIAFREADAVKMLTAKLQKEKGGAYEVKSNTISYGTGRADFVAGKLSFPATFKAVIAKVIDIAALRAQVMGKSEADLRTIIYGLPDTKSARISLWPFWVTSVPKNEAKISISVD